MSPCARLYLPSVRSYNTHQFDLIWPSMTLVEVIGTQLDLGHHKWSGVEWEYHETIEMIIEENVAATTKHHGQQPSRRTCPQEKGHRLRVTGVKVFFSKCVKLSSDISGGIPMTWKCSPKDGVYLHLFTLDFDPFWIQKADIVAAGSIFAKNVFKITKSSNCISLRSVKWF